MSASETELPTHAYPACRDLSSTKVFPPPPSLCQSLHGIIIAALADSGLTGTHSSSFGVVYCRSSLKSSINLFTHPFTRRRCDMTARQNGEGVRGGKVWGEQSREAQQTTTSSSQNPRPRSSLVEAWPRRRSLIHIGARVGVAAADRSAQAGAVKGCPAGETNSERLASACLFCGIARTNQHTRLDPARPPAKASAVNYKDNTSFAEENKDKRTATENLFCFESSQDKSVVKCLSSLRGRRLSRLQSSS